MKQLANIISEIIGVSVTTATLKVQQAGSYDFLGRFMGYGRVQVEVVITLKDKLSTGLESFGSLILCEQKQYQLNGGYVYSGYFLKGEETCKLFKDLAEAFSA